MPTEDFISSSKKTLQVHVTTFKIEFSLQLLTSHVVAPEILAACKTRQDLLLKDLLMGTATGL
jgi:hypothetical protein